MPNLILLNPLSEPNLSRIMSELTELQHILRRPAAIVAMGKRCPKFVRTKWFYMVDMLAFLFGRSEGIALDLQELSQNEDIRGFILAEAMELYAIRVP
jgi:hypothetical protein